MYLSDEITNKLLNEAFTIQNRAYAPYSNFRVGAALLCGSGKIYHGCNIENASYSPTCCAERLAIFKAISEGERDFLALAIVSDSNQPTPPCGVCRQVLAEFCQANMPIICSDKNGKFSTVSLGELLPMVFTKRNME